MLTARSYYLILKTPICQENENKTGAESEKCNKGNDSDEIINEKSVLLKHRYRQENTSKDLLGNLTRDLEYRQTSRETDTCRVKDSNRERKASSEK